MLPSFKDKANNIALKISYKIVALFTENYPSKTFIATYEMSASNKTSDSKGTKSIFDLKVQILFIGYDVTIKYGLHLELSS